MYSRYKSYSRYLIYKYFLPFYRFLLIFMMVSIEAHFFKVLMMSNVSAFTVVVCAFHVMSKKSYNPRSQRLIPVFSFKNFVFSVEMIMWFLSFILSI